MIRVFRKFCQLKDAGLELRGKLRPTSTEPYKFIERLNPIAYRLDLPVQLKHVHNVFHISQIMKYTLDADHAIVFETIEVSRGLGYEEHSVQIIDRKIKQLRIKQIPLVKVYWVNHTSSEATWRNRRWDAS